MAICSYSEAGNSQNKFRPSEVKPEIIRKRSKILGSRQVRSRGGRRDIKDVQENSIVGHSGATLIKDEMGRER